MNTIGSLSLISGIVGIAAIMLYSAIRPRSLSRGVMTALIVVFLILACVGLILVTIGTGGRSLHTGG